MSNINNDTPAEGIATCPCPDWFKPVVRYTHHNECPLHVPFGDQVPKPAKDAAPVVVSGVSTHPAPLPSDLSLEVRKQLWLSHGCSFNYLYGDDGEMQCNRRPFIDFRHASETEILAKIDAHNRERFAEIQAAALLVGEK